MTTEVPNFTDVDLPKCAQDWQIKVTPAELYRSAHGLYGFWNAMDDTKFSNALMVVYTMGIFSAYDYITGHSPPPLTDQSKLATDKVIARISRAQTAYNNTLKIVGCLSFAAGICFCFGALKLWGII